MLSPGLKAYLTALRPWSFTASLTPVILGSSLGYKTHGEVNMLVVVCLGLTALAVHAAGNLVNTYYDYKRGVDNKKSDDRTLVDSLVEVNDVAFMGGACYAFGCVGLVVLSFLSKASLQHLSLVYFLGLSGSFLYTGGLGLKYIALGDLVIFMTFGPVTVLFAYLSVTGDLSLLTIPYAIPLAMNIECVLHSNNCRDRVSDQMAGIVTLAIILGPDPSYFLFCVLLFGPYIAFTYAILHYSIWFILPALTVVIAFKIERDFRAGDLAILPQKVAMLNSVLGLAFTTAILMVDKEQLPFL